MKRFLILVAIAAVAAIPALLLRFGGWRPDPLLDTAVFGIAVLAAGFMLSWGAEAAERRIAQGLILAGVALVTVLPEYAVDIYYAFQAGRDPQSNYVHYAAANMTGANRLLIGIGWPLMLLVHWRRNGKTAIELTNAGTEMRFLLIASVYAFFILLKNRIDLFDFAILTAIFGAYLWKASRSSGAATEADEDDDPGPAAALRALKPGAQWAWMGGLTVAAALIIVASAAPFAEAMVDAGRVIGINEFLLIQWLAPLASEAPAITVAVLFVLSGQAARALTIMISDKFNQWTLLVGMLPLAMTVGAGGWMALPFDARQHEEFFLTAAQSLFGLSLLAGARFGWRSALALASLFSIQLALAFVFQHDQAKTIFLLTTVAWVYLVLAALIFAYRLPHLLRATSTGRTEPGERS